ncbi:MAG: TetR/AcrR family transcriptional regulator [Janthinobacterium lividum]
MSKPVPPQPSKTRSPRTGENTSLSKILNGTFRAIGQRGIRKLSMNDIAETAGVSRGTLYRHFSTKEDALVALAEHVSLQFERGVVDVAAGCKTVEETLEAVLDYHFKVTVEQQGARLMEIEPLFMLQFFRSHLPRHVAALTRALDPYYDHVEQQAGRPLDRPLCSEALIRLQLSTILVPGAENWSRMPKLIWQIMSLFGSTNTNAVAAPRPVAPAKPASRPPASRAAGRSL